MVRGTPDCLFSLPAIGGGSLLAGPQSSPLTPKWALCDFSAPTTRTPTTSIDQGEKLCFVVAALVAAGCQPLTRRLFTQGEHGEDSEDGVKVPSSLVVY